jgi:hypothetical protein
MNSVLITAALLTATLASVSSPTLAANVDVSINIGQPGYYGPLDIRAFGRPRVIFQEPIVVQRVYSQREPVYLHVPPGHAKHWSKHCAQYNACGERVYFVQDSWYNREYVPRYQAEHHDRGDMRREDRGDDHRDGRGDDRNDDDRGNGHGKHGNKGHGKDH